VSETPTHALEPDVERGRSLYAERRWPECCLALEAAERVEPLGGEDLKRLSVAYYLAGRDDESVQALVRGHRMASDLGEWGIATICAFWLFYIHGQRGEVSRASGWAARTRSMVAEHAPGGAAAGYAALVDARDAIAAGDLERSRTAATHALEAGVAAHDTDLQVAARLTIGETLVLMGRGGEALPALDLVHVAMDDDLTPTVAGMAYCAAVATCLALSDLRRAREWTAALTDWCAGQPDVMPYRGQCLADRARILTLGGSWSEAMTEAQAACGVLPEHLVGLAWYERGELHRLLGEFDLAEDAYRRANSSGHQPEPGLARLRLAQGRIAAAATTVRRLVTENRRRDRPEILVAYVEVMLACDDLDAADEAVAQLDAMATEIDVPLLRARAAEAKARVLVARGEVAGGLPLLRQALETWVELGLPYDAARTREVIGDCMRAVGDHEAGDLEHDAARETYQRLGAGADLARLDNTSASSGSLTPREVEVVRLVAAGRTNRQVAGELVLSEKTVARHLSNIYAKLGISSRAAATAYAYDHRLV
jgi:DNA-binding CsgD family transcriptional regulator